MGRQQEGTLTQVYTPDLINSLYGVLWLTIWTRLSLSPVVRSACATALLNCVLTKTSRSLEHSSSPSSLPTSLCRPRWDSSRMEHFCSKRELAALASAVTTEETETDLETHTTYLQTHKSFPLHTYIHTYVSLHTALVTVACACPHLPACS